MGCRLERRVRRIGHLRSLREQAVLRVSAGGACLAVSFAPSYLAMDRGAQEKAGLGAQRASCTTRGVDSPGTTGALPRAPDGRSGWPNAHLRTRLPTTLLATELVAQLHMPSRRCSAGILF